MIKTKVFFFVILTLWASCASAQWQVSNNAVPYGKGPGKVGFGSVAPGGTGHNCLLDTAPPTFGSCGTSSTSITGASSSVFPVVNTAAFLEIINTQNTGGTGSQIILGKTAGSPIAMIGTSLNDGTPPGFGTLKVAIRDGLTNNMRTVAEFDRQGALVMGGMAPGGYQNFAGVNQYGFQAVYGTSKTSNLIPPTTNQQSTAGGYFVGVNDNANVLNVNPASYGIYAEGNAANGSFAAGAEIDSQNISGQVPRNIDPNNMFGSGPGPIAVSIWSQPNGSSVASTLNSSAWSAIIAGGGFAYKKGLVFGTGVVESVGGNTEMIAAPLNYQVAWYNGAGTSIGRLYSDGTSLFFLNSGGTKLEMLPSYIRMVPLTVGTLPACGAGNSGARSFVTDSNATTFAAVVAAGGANQIPVYCDGTSWRIG